VKYGNSEGELSREIPREAFAHTSGKTGSGKKKTLFGDTFTKGSGEGYKSQKKKGVESIVSCGSIRGK